MCTVSHPLPPHAHPAPTISQYTMVFLPGDHVLDENITVANVSRLTMHGNSLSDNIATVVHNGSVGLSFTKMVDFNIYSLAFTSYNRSWSYGSHPSSNSALIFQPVQYAKLVNLFFLQQPWHCYCIVNCTGIALEGNSTSSYAYITSVELSHRVRYTAFNNHWKLLEYFLCWVNLSISTSSLKFK